MSEHRRGRGHSTESTADGSLMRCFMLNRFVLLLAIACAVASGEAAKVSAQSCASDSAWDSNVPRSLFFVGAGAGLELVASGEQSVFNEGISKVTGAVSASGIALGPPVTPTL